MSRYAVSLDGFVFTYYEDEDANGNKTQHLEQAFTSAPDGMDKDTMEPTRAAHLGKVLVVEAVDEPHAVLAFNQALSINSTTKQHKVSLVGDKPLPDGAICPAPANPAAAEKTASRRRR